MSTLRETAENFFDAVESGQGWAGCSRYCHPDAGFSAQAGLLAEIQTVEAYAEFMVTMGPTLPDASHEMRGFAVDEERGCAIGYAVFHATHTGEGGPVPPTGKKVAADFVHVMQFEGDRIKHVTKVWNDVYTMQQLGWA